jgi:hypothetical protein
MKATETQMAKLYHVVWGIDIYARSPLRRKRLRLGTVNSRGECEVIGSNHNSSIQDCHSGQAAYSGITRKTVAFEAGGTFH